MTRDQGAIGSGNLVGGDACSNPRPAKDNSTIDITTNHCLSHLNDNIRINRVVATVISYLMAKIAEFRNHFFL